MFGTSWRMPAEWEPHKRTWMAFPVADYILGDTAESAHEARSTWASVANAIVEFEPVCMLVAQSELEFAREYLDSRVELIIAELDDSWMRDIGPSFVIGTSDAELGQLGGVDWFFNGWGNQNWTEWAKDAKVAKTINKLANATRLESPLINEGGAIHVNGAGTVLLTKTVQLGEGRNNMWSQREVEEEIHRKLGTTKAVWFERGLWRDYQEFGTRGHVDMLAVFCDENRILYHDQTNPEHPDFAVSQELRATILAAGFEAVPLTAPVTIKDAGGWVDYNYVNHYLCNGAVILCGFDDPNDQLAVTTLQQIYPDRQVVLLDARPIFERGGGIHCITQQEPA